MARYVALLRGINVGRNARIAMADLRALVTELGYTGVRTHLQSGNLVFDSAEPVAASARAELEAAIVGTTGVASRVILLSAEWFRRIVAQNPLLDVAHDPSRMVVTFLDEMPDAGTIERPSDEELAPERLVLGSGAVYQWCPDGLLESKLPLRFWKQFAGPVTARNLRTVQAIAGMLDEQ